MNHNTGRYRSLLYIVSLTVVIGLLVFGQGCSGRSTSNPALIVLPGATKVLHGGMYSSSYVSYRIKEKYPAKSALQTISNSLKKQGYKPLKEDYLNPGLPTSHVRGWTEYIDSTRSGGRPGGPDRMVKAWMSDWINDRGDLVMYNLRYIWPLNGPENLVDLRINANYTPAKAAKELRRQVLKKQR